MKREESKINQSAVPNGIRLSLLHYGYATVGKGWKGEVITPPFSRLYYVTEGSANIWADDGKSYLLKKDEWLLIPSECSFSYNCENEMSHAFFHIKLSDYDRMDLLSLFTVPTYLSFPNKMADDLNEAIKTGRLTALLRLYHSISEVLLAFIEKYNPGIEHRSLSPTTLKAITYIKQHLSAKLTVQEVAEKIFVSKSSLTKHFQNELKLSVNHYINNLILQEAAELVAYTNMTMLEISEQFGFYDQFYFSRKFKEKYAVSPRDYRKRSGA